MAQVVSGGVRISYVVEGEGEPVVLLHGMGASYARQWAARGWPEALSEAGFQVVGIDARGCGGSQKVNEPSLFRNGLCTSDAMDVLDSLGVQSAHLIGYSMGAGHALRAAWEFPERVRSLVLGGCNGISLAMAGLYLESAMNSREKLIPSRTAVVNMLGKRGEYERSYAEAYFEALQQDALEDGDLEGIPMPTLIVMGEQDKGPVGFDPRVASEALLSRIPFARRLVVENADHNTCIGDARFKEAVLSFLQSR